MGTCGIKYSSVFKYIYSCIILLSAFYTSYKLVNADGHQLSISANLINSNIATIRKKSIRLYLYYLGVFVQLPTFITLFSNLNQGVTPIQIIISLIYSISGIPLAMISLRIHYIKLNEFKVSNEQASRQSLSQPDLEKAIETQFKDKKFKNRAVRLFKTKLFCLIDDTIIKAKIISNSVLYMWHSYQLIKLYEEEPGKQNCKIKS